MQELLATAEPVALAGDYNVIPTDIDVYKPERWVKDALFLAEVRSAFANLAQWAGPTPCVSYIQMTAFTLFGITSEMPICAMPAYASIICF